MKYIRKFASETDEILNNHSKIIEFSKINQAVKVQIEKDWIKQQFHRALIKLRGYFLWLSILNRIRIYGTNSHLLDSFDRYRKDLPQILSHRSFNHFSTEQTLFFSSLIRPDSQFFNYWNFLILIIFLYSFIVMPWVIAFEEVYIINNWFIADAVVDIICLFDILITLNTPYYDLHGRLVVNRKRIFLNYLRGYLVFDLLSIFPFYLFYESKVVVRSNSIIRILKITNISKVLRGSKILKVIKYLKHSERISKIIKFISFYRTFAKLLLLIFCIFIMSHFIGCLFCYTARLDNYSPATWVSRYGLEDSPKEVIYLKSLYFIITILTTVGFGDITPQTFAEIILCILWMLLGICFYSTVVSTISSLFSTMDSRRVVISEQLNELEALGRFYKTEKACLKHLKDMVSSNVMFNRRINENDKEKILKEMPKKIQIMILNNIYKEAIKKIKFFKDKDCVFLIYLLPKLRYSEAVPNRFIYKKNDEADNVFFILKGRVSYTLGHSNFQFKTLVSGSYFGEIEILKECKRMFNVVSDDNCEFLVMKSLVLNEIMRKFPYIGNEIWLLAQKRTIKNSECYNQMADLIEIIDIRKSSNIQSLAGKRKKINKNETIKKFILMDAEESENLVLDEIEDLKSRLEAVSSTVHQ